jgi:predicted dehydrogenase
VIDLSRRQRLFCMEAMWTRCLPLMQALPHLLKSGAIGDIRMLKAEFGSLPTFDKDNRFFNPALGAGAMLDLGIYLLSLASYVLGPPESVVSQASIGETGVDEQSAALPNYASGKMAIISCSLVTRLPTDALIIGTRGNIRIHSPVHCPRELTLTTYPDLDGRDGVSTGQRRQIKPLSSLLGRVKTKLQSARDTGDHATGRDARNHEHNGRNPQSMEPFSRSRGRLNMRIGIIGCGYVADFYLMTLPNYPELTVAGVTDRDQERAHRLWSLL